MITEGAPVGPWGRRSSAPVYDWSTLDNYRYPSNIWTESLMGHIGIDYDDDYPDIWSPRSKYLGITDLSISTVTAGTITCISNGTSNRYVTYDDPQTNQGETR